METARTNLQTTSHNQEKSKKKESEAEEEKTSI